MKDIPAVDCLIERVERKLLDPAHSILRRDAVRRRIGLLQSSLGDAGAVCCRAEARIDPNVADFQPGIALEQVIRGNAGTTFGFGEQIWRGEMAEFTAQAIVGDLG